jgi:hypothetical protein
MLRQRFDEVHRVVAPGYLADLLLIDGDPLADITILQDHDRLHYIMKDGKFHKQNPTDEAPAPDPANMPATGTERLVSLTTESGRERRAPG